MLIAPRGTAITCVGKAVRSITTTAASLMANRRLLTGLIERDSAGVAILPVTVSAAPSIIEMVLLCALATKIWFVNALTAKPTGVVPTVTVVVWLVAPSMIVTVPSVLLAA